MASLTIVRLVRARPSFVFEAMTTAEGIKHWWGPDDTPVLFAEVDPRVGGRFRVRFRRANGSEHESCGAFLELVPQERFAMSWRWVGGEEDFAQSRIDVVLRAVLQGTEVTFTHSQLGSEAARLSHEEGWGGSFAKLEHYCGGQW